MPAAFWASSPCLTSPPPDGLPASARPFSVSTKYAVPSSPRKVFHQQNHALQLINRRTLESLPGNGFAPHSSLDQGRSADGSARRKGSGRPPPGADSLMTWCIKCLEHGRCHGPRRDVIARRRPRLVEEQTGGFEQSKKSWKHESRRPQAMRTGTTA